MGLEARNVVATVEVMAVALMNSRRVLVPFGFSEGGGLVENCFSSEFMREGFHEPDGASSAVFRVSKPRAQDKILRR